MQQSTNVQPELEPTIQDWNDYHNELDEAHLADTSSPYTVKVNPHPYWDAAGSGGRAVTMPGGGSDAYAGIVTAALRAVGLPTTRAYVQAWLSQGKTGSGLNPKARQKVNDINMRLGMPAQGIVQVIPPTFAAYSLQGMKDIYNPVHNFAAGMNYAKSRYGVAGMLSALGRGRGYEDGTESALPGWAWVGEAGPELVNFGGGERVMPHRESIQASTRRSMTREEADMIGKAVAKYQDGGIHFNGGQHAMDPQGLIDGVIQKLNTQRALAAPMARIAERFALGAPLVVVLLW